MSLTSKEKNAKNNNNNNLTAHKICAQLIGRYVVQPKV